MNDTKQHSVQATAQPQPYVEVLIASIVADLHRLANMPVEIVCNTAFAVPPDAILTDRGVLTESGDYREIMAASFHYYARQQYIGYADVLWRAAEHACSRSEAVIHCLRMIEALRGNLRDNNLSGARDAFYSAWNAASEYGPPSTTAWHELDTFLRRECSRRKEE